MQRDEFEKLAIAELDAVYRFSRFLTKDPDAAEELVQDVYARAFRPESIAGFTSRGAGMRAWLMTIARTSFYGRLEHEQAGNRALRRVTDQARDTGESSETVSAAEAGEIDLALAGTRMQEAMDSMSVELREVLWFWGVEGLKYREIAEALAVPIGTVMSRLHRARSQAARFLRNDATLAPQLGRAGIIEPRPEAQAADSRD
ncbi:MAG: sigma-70 family RNA polymerase sigma factor [Planctomycetota bacterium]